MSPVPRLNTVCSCRAASTMVIIEFPACFPPVKGAVKAAPVHPHSGNRTSVHSNKIEQAKLVGKRIAEKAKEKGINTVVFDRNGFLYHGRVKNLADAARESGLKL